MKKNLLIALSSLTSVLIGTLSTSCSSNPPHNEEDYCDPTLFDCDEENKKDEEEKVELKKYDLTNYEYDNSVSNKDGSMSYEIFVRSFADSDGDGIGDFDGVTSKLDYLKNLGIKTIWLMPIMPSPTYHGYDVLDYYSVNPEYGSMDDFLNLVKVASEKNIDVMIDIVFNHSSVKHPWFIQSYEDYTSGYDKENSFADWYCWSDKAAAYNHSYNGSRVFYEGRFDSSMPDFNTKNEAVRNEFVKILNFWIEKGVKGFRFDAVKYFDYENASYNAEFLTYLKENISDQSVYFVGECFDNINKINDYYKSKCDSFFKFNASMNGYGNDTIIGQAKINIKSNLFGDLIESQEKILKENNPNGYSSYFISNHDLDRASKSLSGEHAKSAASLLSLLPGTPFMYYGEEIELKGKRNTSPDDQSDVLRRLPMIWSKENKDDECDFPESNRQDLNHYEQVELGAFDQEKVGFSLLNHYKKVINVRNKYPFIKNSNFKNLTSKIETKNENILAYELTYNDERIVVIHNFSYFNSTIDLKGVASEIVDVISQLNYIPELDGSTLKIGQKTTLVLK